MGGVGMTQEKGKPNYCNGTYTTRNLLHNQSQILNVPLRYHNLELMAMGNALS
jgi:hypothetical protein